jgi:hypothetical protein
MNGLADGLAFCVVGAALLVRTRRRTADIESMACEQPPPSQRELKRQAKKLKSEAKYARMKDEKREQKRMARAERESRSVWSGEPVKVKRRGTQIGKQKRKERAEGFLQACEKGYKVVIDCSFEENMGEREKKSLVQQVMYCHGANKRAACPCR